MRTSLTSNKLYWIEDQLTDVSSLDFIHLRVGVGKLNHQQLDRNSTLQFLFFFQKF